jgi:hypothetical protein
LTKPKQPERYDKVQAELLRDDKSSSPYVYLLIYLRVAKDPENPEERNWRRCKVKLEKQFIENI